MNIKECGTHRPEHARGQDEYDEITSKIASYRRRLSITNERSWLHLIECEQYNLAQHLNRYSK